MHASEYHWSQVRVGLFISLVGILIFAAAVYIGLAGTPFASRATLLSQFDDVAGLAVGSPVELGGVVIGEISALDLPDIETGKVPVKIAVEHRALNHLGPSSLAFNASHALVGQRYLGLTPRKPGEPALENGATLSSKAAPELDSVIEKATATLEEIGVLSRTLVRALESREGTLGRLLQDDALYEELHATARNLNALSEEARTGEGPLAALVGDKALASQLRTGVGAFAVTAQRVRDGQGVLGRLTQDGKTSEALELTLSNLASVSTRLTEAEGTLGALINDPAMLGQMNSLIGEMDRLVGDVRRNPQRYLKVQAF